MLYLYFQLVDKLNTNTEMEEMINDYNIVSKLCKLTPEIQNVGNQDMMEHVDCTQ